MHSLSGWPICVWAATSILISFSAGCQVLRPDPIVADRPYNIAPELAAIDQQPIEIGKPNKVIDTIGTIVGIPGKVLLWDRRIDNHKISGRTIEATADYMAASNLGHVKVRANQYAPLKDWKRLKANKSVHWLSRYTLGVLALGGEAILPGRIVGGDHFNPFTQTVHLYSDVPAIAWHELAHAKDFSRRDSQASYSLAYTSIPLWHETIASQDVMSYVADRGDREEIAETIEILYPAYGTYAGAGAAAFSGGLSLPVHYGTVIGAHVNARILAKKVRRGEDLGPLTSVAQSSLIGQFDHNYGEASSTPPPLTSFRDTPVQAFDSSTSVGFSSLRFDPRIRISLPGGQVRELGREWGEGLAGEIGLDSAFDQPVTVSYLGNSSESQVDWSSTTLSLQGFNARYRQDFHDVLIGYRVDANGESMKMHPQSDQLLLGLRYLYFGDQVDERLQRTFSVIRQIDSEISATNHVFAPSVRFLRQYRYGRWISRGSVGGFAGLAGIHQRSSSLGTDTFGRTAAGPASELESVNFATGQSGEFSIGSNWGSSRGSRWSIQGGLKARYLTGVATSIADYASGGASDPDGYLWMGRVRGSVG